MKPSRLDYLLVVVWGFIGILNALSLNYAAAAFSIVIICGLYVMMLQEDLLKEYRGFVEIQTAHIKKLTDHLSKEATKP